MEWEEMIIETEPEPDSVLLREETFGDVNFGVYDSGITWISIDGYGIQGIYTQDLRDFFNGVYRTDGFEFKGKKG